MPSIEPTSRLGARLDEEDDGRRAGVLIQQVLNLSLIHI